MLRRVLHRLRMWTRQYSETNPHTASQAAHISGGYAPEVATIDPPFIDADEHQTGEGDNSALAFPPPLEDGPPDGFWGYAPRPDGTVPETLDEAVKEYGQ